MSPSPANPNPEEDKCLRCGQCCHVYHMGLAIPCPYLIELKDNKTSCLVYDRRLTMLNNGKPICMLRKNSEFDFPNCPYNTGKPFPP